MERREQKTVRTPKGDVTIRKGESGDVSAISALTRQEKLLYRPPEEVEALLPAFFVAEHVGSGGIVGCVSAATYGDEAEIVSFRVRDDFLGMGIGRELLSAELAFLRGREDLSRIFALTTRGVFEKSFRKAGFREVGIQLFGPKVARVCSRCPKNVYENGRHLCDEIAVIYDPTGN
jgi:N-acetylglutamate synthase-like GNAT family acetyltransferase